CKTVLIRASSYKHWDKVKIIRCGIDLSEFEALPPPSTWNHTLVCVGRLCPQKGQLLLPKAVAELSTEFPDLRVRLVGDGESRAEIEEAIAKYGVEDLIEVVGWATNEDVRAAIADSRAFLLPSFAEGLPVVFMESLAMCRPVIGTYVAGIPELVDEECGWMIPPGDEVALVSAMRAALRATPEELAELGATGRRRVEERHNLEVLAESFDKYFDELPSHGHA
ncbi:MAG: glycosyltransferase family 4 protein, partial [Acidimicrobiia bacterium]